MLVLDRCDFQKRLRGYKKIIRPAFVITGNIHRPLPVWTLAAIARRQFRPDSTYRRKVSDDEDIVHIHGLRRTNMRPIIDNITHLPLFDGSNGWA